MNKTLNINLAGLIFHIDEDAFHRLERYLEILKRQFSHTEGGNEIISDIETRIAELFRERTSESKEVINLGDVDEVIGILGQPEDYLDTEATEDIPPQEETYSTRGKRIFRDPDNRVLGGVSSGLAAYFNIDPLWIRLLFVLLLFAGPGVLIYIIMWIVIPKARTTAEKLQMRGEPVNISNIQRSIRDEMKGVEDRARHFSKRAANYDYGRSAKGVGGFFSDLGRFLADTIRLIFNFLIKLIGFIFLFIGFVLLFAIVMSLFVGVVDIAGMEYGVQHFFEFMRLVTESDSHYTLLMMAIVLSVIAPLFLLVYLGIRILFDLDPLNRPTKSALGFVTFLGLVLLLIAGVRIGFQFDDESHITREIALPESRVYYLETADDSISRQFTENHDLHWINFDRMNAFNLMEADIRHTDRDEPYLELKIESQGESRKDARHRAEDIRFEIDLKDSVISMPNHYRLAENDKFRAQEVEVILYLPRGYSVYIDKSLADYLYDVDNVQHMWDYEMAGRLWHMTEFGLSCEGCEIPMEERADTTKTDTGADNVDVKIDKRGIEIDYKNDGDSGKVRISSVQENNLRPQSFLKIISKNYEITI